MRVLLVEDNESERTIAEQFLKRLDIETVSVFTLEDAILLDFRESFDLILLDTVLPDSCSPQVTRYFAETARASVVVMTGCTDWFSSQKDHSSIVLLERKDFAGRLSEVLEIVRQKIGTASY